ncbi:MAG TPA: hypothetical protein PKD31_17065, partial [Blastocatellia bacterium]|nr:hypothetical protein [Blastocatellia bacterium]
KSCFLAPSRLRCSFSLVARQQFPKQLTPSGIARSKQDFGKALRRDALQIFQPAFFNQVKPRRFRFQFTVWELVIPLHLDSVLPKVVSAFDFYSDATRHGL